MRGSLTQSVSMAKRVSAQRALELVLEEREANVERAEEF